jgi:hypothetical protein
MLSTFFDDFDHVPFRIVNLKITDALPIMLDCSDLNPTCGQYIFDSADLLGEQDWSLASFEVPPSAKNDRVSIRYALSRWDALTRYIEDGHIEIDNNAAERSLRGVALGPPATRRCWQALVEKANSAKVEQNT